MPILPFYDDHFRNHLIGLGLVDEKQKKKIGVLVNHVG